VRSFCLPLGQAITFNEESMHYHNFEESEWPFNFSIETEVFTTKYDMLPMRFAPVRGEILN